MLKIRLVLGCQLKSSQKMQQKMKILREQSLVWLSAISPDGLSKVVLSESRRH